MILKAFGYREVEAAGIFFGLSVYASCSASDKWGYASLFYTFKVILVVVTHKVILTLDHFLCHLNYSDLYISPHYVYFRFLAKSLFPTVPLQSGGETQVKNTNLEHIKLLDKHCPHSKPK